MKYNRISNISPIGNSLFFMNFCPKKLESLNCLKIGFTFIKSTIRVPLRLQILYGDCYSQSQNPTLIQEAFKLHRKEKNRGKDVLHCEVGF